VFTARYSLRAGAYNKPDDVSSININIDVLFSRSILYRNVTIARGRAVYGVHLTPLAGWDCGFESRRGHGCLSAECCLLSVSGLCDELITRPEVSYRLWCVLCDLETSWIRRPWLALGRSAKNKKWAKCVISCLCCMCYCLLGNGYMLEVLSSM
jgi:hypothetical protein